MRAMTLYSYRRKMFAHSLDRTRSGVWVASPPMIELESDSEGIASGIRTCLSASRSDIDHPDSLVGLLRPILSLAHVRTYADFAKSARSVNVERLDDVVTLTPTRNAGVKGGYIGAPHLAKSCSVDSAELGDLALKALSQSTGADKGRKETHSMRGKSTTGKRARSPNSPTGASHDFASLRALEDDLRGNAELAAGAATQEQIMSAEQYAGFHLPPEYRAFLERFGAAIVGPYGVYGFGVAPGMSKVWPSVIEVTEHFRSDGWRGTFDTLVIAVDHSGNAITLDASGLVHRLDHDSGQVENLAATFGEFVRACLSKAHH
jgi:hypothetical protein